MLTMREMRKETRLIYTVIALILILALTACGSEWQEHYDLGMKYLTDGNYEEAIIEFEVAIEIDESKADAYIGLAEVYIEQGDLQKAIEILEEGYEKTKDESISAKLEEIKSGAVYDMQGNMRMMTHYNENGELDWYHVYDYDGDKISKATRYNASGKAKESVECKYDADGNGIQDYVYDTDSGELIKSINTFKNGKVVKKNQEEDSRGFSYIYEISYSANGQTAKEVKNEYYKGEHESTSVNEITYDSAGNETSEIGYDEDANKLSSYTFEYDENGNLLKQEWFSYDNGKRVLEGYWILEYDDNGERIADYEYDADGNLIGSMKY